MSENKQQPKKVEATTTEKAPAAVAKEASSTVSKPKAPQKALMLGGIVVAVLALLSGLVLWGMNSNKKIPVFSAAASSMERGMFNKSKSVRKDAVEDIFKPYMDELEDYAGEKMTSADLQAILMNDNKAKDAERESVSINGSMKVELSEEILEAGGSNMGEFIMDFDFDGYTLADVSKDRPVLEMDGTYSLSADMDGEKVEGSAELKLVNEIIYGKVYDVVPDLGAEYEDVIGEWFSYDLSSYYDILEESMEMVDDSDEDSAEVLFEQEDLDMINEMLYSDAVLDSISYLEDRNIDGVQTKCMQYDFDEEDVIALVKIAASYEEDFDDDEMDEMIADMRDEMDETLGGGFTLVVDTCTGRGDGLLYFVSMEYKMEGVKVYMEAEYSDYGVEKDIKAPKDALSLDSELNDMIPSTDVDYSDDDYDYSDYDYDWSDYDFDEDYGWDDDSIDW